MSYRLIVELEIVNVSLFHTFWVVIENVCKSRPEHHVDLIEVVVEDIDLVLMKSLFVVLIDNNHQEDAIYVVKVTLSEWCQPFKVVVDDLLEYLIEDVGTLPWF